MIKNSLSWVEKTSAMGYIYPLKAQPKPQNEMTKNPSKQLRERAVKKQRLYCRSTENSVGRPMEKFGRPMESSVDRYPGRKQEIKQTLIRSTCAVDRWSFSVDRTGRPTTLWKTSEKWSIDRSTVPVDRKLTFQETTLILKHCLKISNKFRKM